MVKKIVIIGPESTGKSTLSRQLAKHFNTTWCPEYAREYLLQNGIEYTYDDLLKIAQGQLVMEDYLESMVNGQWSMVNNESSTQSPAPAARSPLLFIDTNMYVMKVWYEYVFGKCEQFVLDEIVQRKYDLYLLCNIDLPWVAEPMREYPDIERRKELYNMYKDILINQQTPWVEISGNYEERLQKAINAVEKYFFV
jgi:NadR type nicotinamide-nucleotide adenylyltransferase